MATNQENNFFNNVIFVVLLVLLAIGAIKNSSTEISWEVLTQKMLGQAQQVETDTYDFEDEKPSIFDTVQEERIRQKIDYGTAMQYFQTRALTGTEIQELGMFRSTSSYFGRKSDKKLIFYPTTGSDVFSQQFMRDFTRFRTNMRSRSDFVFIPIETGLVSNERQIKNTSDRVIYNLRKECGKFCVINVSAYTVTSLKSPEISVKTYEIVEALINSL